MKTSNLPDLQILTILADRHLPGVGPCRVARTESGTSTPVFRIQRDGVTRYLRLAESAEANLAPEALVLENLHARGVRVPEVLHFESFSQDVGRSLMIISEIPGQPVATQHTGLDHASVLRTAGRDLAHIHDIAVAGFGFVRRDPEAVGALYGSLASFDAFVFGEFEAQLAALAAVFTVDEIGRIQHAADTLRPRIGGPHGLLAHGDLDATHIYHHDGQYIGIIDFGEIRGTDQCYDLGHLALHDREIVPYPLLPHILDGYTEISPLPDDAQVRIQAWRLLIGVRALSRGASHIQTAFHAHLHRGILESLDDLGM